MSVDVARRSGLANERYRTVDGRFVMTDKDLQRVRLLPDEIVNGLDAIMLTKQEAEHLIAENGLKMGFSDNVETEDEVAPAVETEVVPESSSDGDGESEEEVSEDADAVSGGENEEEV